MALSKSIDLKCLDELFKQEHVLRQLYTNLVTQYEFKNGEQNIGVLESLLDIAHFYLEELGDTYNSVIFCEKTLQICDILFKDFIKYSADDYYYMACCNLMDDNLEKVFECLNIVLEMRQTLLGETHPNT